MHMPKKLICPSNATLCQLVHVHIWDNYVSMYVSYRPLAIYNVTRNTGKHTFHIIGICPWKNMPPISDIYVLLHYYICLNTDPTLLDIQVQKKLQFLVFIKLLSYPKASNTLPELILWSLYLCLAMSHHIVTSASPITAKLKKSPLRHCVILSICLCFTRDLKFSS